MRSQAQYSTARPNCRGVTWQPYQGATLVMTHPFAYHALNDRFKARASWSLRARVSRLHAHVPAYARPWLFAGAMMASALSAVAATPPAAPPAAEVQQLMTRDLISDPNKEVLMLTVTYPAAGASLPHRHDAQVFVYVLEGELTMQVRGEAPVTVRQGQWFYEAPGDVHEVSANLSRVAPAKILVLMVKDKGTPVSRPVADGRAP
jgi:quercetin dioxygenase-like cupin family protein